jgi:lauroyl/myristoyl acyltransferase
MKTYYLLRIASVVVRLVPPRLGYWLASVIGGVVFGLNHSVRGAVLDNLRHVLPKATHRQRRQMARRTVRNVVKNYYDLLRLPHMKVRDLERTITLEGGEYMDQALAQGHGLIITSGHIGNFSIVAQLAVARGYKVTIIAEDIVPPKLYDYVNSLREHFGLRMIKLGSAQALTIYRLLKNNEILMLAIDRDVANDGIPTIFFDALADMPPGPIALALRLNTPLIYGYTFRKPDSTSLVQLAPPVELVRTGDRDLDLKINMRRMAQILEEQILKNPSQWVVLQKIWDKDYTGTTGTEAAQAPEPPIAVSTSLNGNAPQLNSESANPPELQIAEKKLEIRN